MTPEPPGCGVCGATSPELTDATEGTGDERLCPECLLDLEDFLSISNSKDQSDDR